MSIDWEQVRGEFPALKNWTYLNTATYGHLPRCGNQALLQHHAHRDEMACSDFLNWYDDMDRVREGIARLIHCGPEDVAFISNASTALGLLLSGMDWQPGDRIVTLEGEFPNNLYAPHFAGAGLDFIETPWDGFYDAITPRTSLVVLSMLNYASGFRPPLEDISRFLRERGVLFFVDGTQGVGVLRFDTARIQPAMLAVHGYKWMMSPTGAGFMYVAPEVRASLQPNVVGWRSDMRWREVDNLHHGRPEFKHAAEKYEGGGLPFSLLYAMQAAVEMMLELGPENIERRALELADAVRLGLRELGADVAYGATPIVAGRFEGRDVSSIARRLMEQRIVVSARHGFLRVSPHMYNNEADIEQLITALRPLL
jgi:cysteine desulfurase/selenocysteine lyase